jgi:hypothetical protein
MLITFFFFAQADRYCVVGCWRTDPILCASARSVTTTPLRRLSVHKPCSAAQRAHTGRICALPPDEDAFRHVPGVYTAVSGLSLISCVAMLMRIHPSHRGDMGFELGEYFEPYVRQWLVATDNKTAQWVQAVTFSTSCQC